MNKQLGVVHATSFQADGSCHHISAGAYILLGAFPAV